MNTYLTQSEISDLKAIRAQYINDNELSELKTFLKIDNKEVTVNKNDNFDTTWNIIENLFTSKFSTNPESILFYKLHPNVIRALDKIQIIQRDLQTLSPKLYKLLNVANNTDFAKAIERVNEYLSELNILNFDSTDFIFNPAFDFKPFTIESVDKSLIDNTIAISKAIAKFFEPITKELSPDQQSIVLKDLFNTISFFVSNSSPSILKEKGNRFKKLVQYVNSQSND